MKPRLKRLLRWALALGLLAVVLGAITLGTLYALVAPTLPDVQALREVELQVPMQVRSADGRVVATFGEFRRYPVAIEDVPAHVRDSFIAIEDARFYEHPGIDWRGITRAVWLVATTGSRRVPGGSTITQQVARQFFLSTEVTFSRKFSEILLALKMERELSKDEILELYLNKSFFGNRAYGVAAAAEYYYGKSLAELTLDEAATLASIPKFPSSGNPIVNPDRARIRRDYVLQRMAEEGFITDAQRVEAQAAPMHASPHEPPVEVEAPWVAEMVRQAVEARYGPDALNQGLVVTTTLDGDAQNAAGLAVRTGLLDYDRRHGWRGAEAQVALAGGETPEALGRLLRPYGAVGGLLPAVVTAVDAEGADVALASGEAVRLEAASLRWAGRTPDAVLAVGDVVRLERARTVDGQPAAAGALPVDIATAPEDGAATVWRLAQVPQAQAALVSLDAEDGAVHALVGGFSFAANKFNRATQAQRQPGSSFKPFVYSAAFERGFFPSSIVLDAPVMFRDAAGSVWRPQNDAGNFAGPMRLREAMVQSRNLVSVRLLDALGIDYTKRYIEGFGFTPESLPPNLSMSLGTASLPPMAIARGYATFSNGGYRVEPYFIRRIQDRNGVVLFEAHPDVACAACPGRGDVAAARSTMVDGFDFGPQAAPDAPAAATAEAAPGTGDAALASLSPDFVGPPSVQLAPRAIDPRAAFMVRSLLRDVVARGTGTAARVLGRADIGGKTGSTNDYRDAWFSGFGGPLVTTVWVGRDDFSTLGSREYGGRAALPVWIDYMRAALDGVDERAEPLPEGLVQVPVDPTSGLPVAPGTPGARADYFRVEDLDRIAAQGLRPAVEAEQQEAFDIF